jgi:hypothetical protein
MSMPASAWSPPLPEASGFDHLVVETPGLHTHVAAIGEGDRSCCCTDFHSTGGSGTP